MTTRGWRRHVGTSVNAGGDCLLERIFGAEHGFVFILAVGRQLRELSRRDKHRTFVGLQFNRIGDHQLRPKSLLIFATSPAPSSFRPPCIGSCVVRHPSLTVTWPLPPLWPWNVQPCFFSHRRNSFSHRRNSLAFNLPHPRSIWAAHRIPARPAHLPSGAHPIFDFNQLHYGHHPSNYRPKSRQ